MAAQNTLLYDHTFWKKLCPEGPKLNTTEKQHLILSLMLYLKSSTLDVLEFMFTTDITPVKRRAGRFVAYCPNSLDETRHFPPAVIYRAWHDRYPDAHDDLHDMIIPCAHEIVLQESDNIIQDKALKVTGSQLTHSAFEDMLTPGKLMGMYQHHAPLTWGLLQTISASPNPYRKRKAREAKQNAMHEAEDDIASEDELDGEGLTEQQGEEVNGDTGAPAKDGPSTKMQQF